MVSAVDDGVGRVLKELKRHGLEENTIVAFLSDNGGPTTKNASTNAPLRGNKGDAWEGGFRVPFAVQWMSKLPAGSSYKNPVSALDLGATIVTLAGAAVSKDKPLDGVYSHYQTIDRCFQKLKFRALIISFRTSSCKFMRT